MIKAVLLIGELGWDFAQKNLFYNFFLESINAFVRHRGHTHTLTKEHVFAIPKQKDIACFARKA